MTNQEPNRPIPENDASYHGMRLLEGELSSLRDATGVSKWFPRAQWGKGRRLTARTLNNEVFPAFCRPTMVTSISIALELQR